MKEILKTTILLISLIRLIPHVIIFNIHGKKTIIIYDILRWMKINKKAAGGTQAGFIKLMTYYPEFRNLFYNRVGSVSVLINFLCPKMNTLFIHTQDIGPGLYIQHGFATIITAKSIGKDCWINQQVTIGFNGADSPVIKDNVTIRAGAKVIGNVTVGGNSIVGANAVVVKNVPGNSTVVGVPAYIIKRDGIKVKESL
ncbi:serine O-acetyltransferase [Mucilaginibacter lappiensis]